MGSTKQVALAYLVASTLEAFLDPSNLVALASLLASNLEALACLVASNLEAFLNPSNLEGLAW